MGDDGEELLQPGRPLLPRRIRLAALLLAVLAVATLIAIREWPRLTHRSTGGPTGTTSAPSGASTARSETTRMARAWPTARGACGEEHKLTIVSSRPPNGRTGVTVLLGGDQLRTVDFDRGRVTAMPQARLHAGEFIIGLIASSQTYAAIADCPRSFGRNLRIGADGSVSVVTLPHAISTIVADDTHAWALAKPENPSPNAIFYLVPLDGGPRVRLPAGFFPQTRVQPHGVITGVGPNNSLLLVDAATGRVRANLGDGRRIAASDGLVVWATGCDPVNDKPCTLHRSSVTGGPTASYRLPRPAIESTGVISPDGRLVAFLLKRPTQDPRFEQQLAPPKDIAVLHLDTGRLEIVPGIEVPATTFPALTAAPGMAFSADGRWLMIALDAFSKIRLLAWRSGLAHPYESNPIAGQVMGLGPGPIPPILVLPKRTDH